MQSRVRPVRGSCVLAGTLSPKCVLSRPKAQQEGLEMTLIENIECIIIKVSFYSMLLVSFIPIMVHIIYNLNKS